MDEYDHYSQQIFSDHYEAIEMNPSDAQDKLIVEAISDIKKCNKMVSNSESPFNEILGDFYFLLRNYDQSISEFTKADELNHENYEYIYDRGVVYYYNGKYDQAISDFNQVMARELNFNFYFETHFFRGLAYYHKGNYDQALSDYNKAIERYPQFKEAYFDCGYIYYRQGDLTKATADFNKAVEVKPAPDFDVVSFFTSFFLTYYQYKFLQHISDYSKITGIDPKLAKDYTERGDVLEQKGKYDQAITNFNRAIAIDPYCAQAYSAKAKALYFTKQYNKAWIDIFMADELGAPNDPEFIKLLKSSNVQSKGWPAWLGYLLIFVIILVFLVIFWESYF